MLDVVKCLREHQGEDDPPWRDCIMDKAADEIERLRAKNRQLAATLATRLLSSNAASLKSAEYGEK